MLLWYAATVVKISKVWQKTRLPVWQHLLAVESFFLVKEENVQLTGLCVPLDESITNNKRDMEEITNLL